MWAAPGFVYVTSFLLVLAGLGMAGASAYATYQLSVQAYRSSLLIGLGYCGAALGATIAAACAASCWAVHRQAHNTLRITSMIMAALTIATAAMGVSAFIWRFNFGSEDGNIVLGMDFQTLHSTESHFKCCGKLGIDMYKQPWYSFSRYDLPASCCSVADSTTCYDDHHYYILDCVSIVQLYAVVLMLIIALILCLGFLPVMIIHQTCGTCLASRYKKMNTRSALAAFPPISPTNGV